MKIGILSAPDPFRASTISYQEPWPSTLRVSWTGPRDDVIQRAVDEGFTHLRVGSDLAPAFPIQEVQ